MNVKAAGSAEGAVEGAEIVVLATKSLRPVVKAEWLSGCRLVHSVGFKSPVGKEMDIDVPLGAAAIVTDSPSQMADFGAKFILHGTDLIDKVTPLADFVAGRRPRPEGLVVSYPLGIAGSDVVVADELLPSSVVGRRHQARQTLPADELMRSRRGWRESHPNPARGGGGLTASIVACVCGRNRWYLVSSA